jgi:serine protease
MSEDHSLDRRRFLQATGAVAGASAMGEVVVATPGREPGPKEHEVLVGVSAGEDLYGAVEPAVPSDAEIVHSNEALRYVAVAFPEANETAQQAFIDSVRNRPGVKYAEINATYEAHYTPNDPLFEEQYAPQQICAPEAWEAGLGCEETTVCVLDTGVQYTHDDLVPNVASNPGYDFHDNDSDPEPNAPSSEYHGTHVSGLACGATDNSEGIAGIGNCRLKIGRVLDQNGSGSTSDIVDAIQWAYDLQYDVINMSLGGGGYSNTMKNAVSNAYKNGTFVVAAAGNGGTSPVNYPAKYTEVVAVGAVDPDEQLASFSNYGPDLDLVAPGVDVLSTTTAARGGYERLSGTSMSAPIVSGVACLTLCQHDIDNIELRAHLENTAEDIGLDPNQQGFGQVSACEAVYSDPPVTHTDRLEDNLTGSNDSDCWSWGWNFSTPSRVDVVLDGPSSADFDLYVNDTTTGCPTTSTYDYRSYSTDSQETISVQSPSTASQLEILVDSYSNSGDYELRVTEFK